MIHADIFDMDGVIVLSESIYTKIFVDMINRDLGLKIKSTDFEKYNGIRFEKRIENICSDNGINLEDEKYIEMANKGRHEYATNSMQSLKLNIGILDFLKELKSRGMHIGVGSNGSKKIVEELLVSLGIRDYFESVIAFEDVDHPKPQPDIYLENANNLFVDTQDCLVFEDSISGITAAKRAGMKCVALTTTMDRMQLIDADLIIDNFTEIDVDKLDEI